VKQVRDLSRFKEERKREEIERNRNVELAPVLPSDKETQSPSTKYESPETKAKDLE
jgi:hypothetical protein